MLEITERDILNGHHIIDEEGGHWVSTGGDVCNGMEIVEVDRNGKPMGPPIIIKFDRGTIIDAHTNVVLSKF